MSVGTDLPGILDVDFVCRSKKFNNAVDTYFGIAIPLPFEDIPVIPYGKIGFNYLRYFKPNLQNYFGVGAEIKGSFFLMASPKFLIGRETKEKESFLQLEVYWPNVGFIPNIFGSGMEGFYFTYPLFSLKYGFSF